MFGALFRAIGSAFKSVLKSGIGRAVLQIAGCGALTLAGLAPACGAISGLSTLASGGSISQALTAAAMSFAQMGVWTVVGQALATAGATIANLALVGMSVVNGAWRDNVFVERLWRTVKYEEVHLRAYDTASFARRCIGRNLDLYNRRHPHSSLHGRTPDRAYFGHTSLPPIRSAARPRQTIHLSKRKNCPNERSRFSHGDSAHPHAVTRAGSGWSSIVVATPQRGAGRDDAARST